MIRDIKTNHSHNATEATPLISTPASDTESSPLLRRSCQHAKGGPGGLLDVASLRAAWAPWERRAPIIFVLLYFAVGTLFYHLNKGSLRGDGCVVSWLDALLFTIVTFSTVGYGNYAPNTPQARLFTVFFALIGVCVVGSCIGMAVAAYAELSAASLNASMTALLKRARRSHPPGQRLESLTAKDVSGDIDIVVSGRVDYKRELLRVLVNLLAVTVIVLLGGAIFHAMEDGAVVPATDCSSDDTSSVDAHSLLKSTVKIENFVPPGIPATETRRSVTYLDGVYWATVTLTTIGFGDYTPIGTPAKIFTIFFILFGTVAVGAALANIASVPITVAQMRWKRRVRDQFSSMCDCTMGILTSGAILRELGIAQDSRYCTQAEFILIGLFLQGKVTAEDLEQLVGDFRRADVDGNGVLDPRDLS